MFIIAGGRHINPSAFIEEFKTRFDHYNERWESNSGRIDTLSAQCNISTELMLPHNNVHLIFNDERTKGQAITRQIIIQRGYVLQFKVNYNEFLV